MKREGISELFFKDGQRSYSPSMTNLEKIVYLGLAGRDFPTSEIISTFRYYQECPIPEFLDLVKKTVQEGRDVKKNLNQYDIADYLDVVSRIDKGDRNFYVIERYFNLIKE